jgi:hypothetical protein
VSFTLFQQTVDFFDEPLTISEACNKLEEFSEVLTIVPVSMANRIEPFSAINFEPLFQSKITYSVLISVDSFPLPA